VSSPLPSGVPPLTRKQLRQRKLAESRLRPGLRPTTLSGAAATMGLTLAALWVVVIIDAILNHSLLRFGIKPRQLAGLWGVLVAPVLHASAGQLAANTIPIAILGWLMLTSGGRHFVLVTASVWLASGLAGWASAPAHHIILGGGGVVFGWLGYLLARAWFGRKVRWIATAIIVLCVFSGLLGGLLPHLSGNSFWVDQLAGFAVGVLVAALLHRRPTRPARSTGTPAATA
jgi:membrane associated rhomboid family serine protease